MPYDDGSKGKLSLFNRSFIEASLSELNILRIPVTRYLPDNGLTLETFPAVVLLGKFEVDLGI